MNVSIRARSVPSEQVGHSRLPAVMARAYFASSPLSYPCGVPGGPELPTPHNRHR